MAELEGQTDTPFLVMLSIDKDIFCSFYHTKDSKIYEPDIIHKMFAALYPDHELSELEMMHNHKMDICYLHYISRYKERRYYHTIFTFCTEEEQIIGHFSRELTELDKLQQRYERTADKNRTIFIY